MAGTVASDIEMANFALDKLYSPPINAFDDSSKQSRWVKRNYAKYRDILLSRHYWNFASELVYLAKDTQKPAFRWEARYKKPTDCLKYYPPTWNGERDGLAVKHQDIGGYIYCDKTDGLPFEYVRRIETEGMFDALFVEAFGWYMAAPLAHVIEGKNSLVQTMQQGYAQAIRDAQVADAIQGTPSPNVPHDYLLTRHSYYEEDSYT